MRSTVSTSPPHWKAIALPSEHGGWGFLLEPILLGLLVTPTWAGLCLALGTFFAFLARQPLKIALVDRRRGRRYARTQLAERFVLLYGALAALGGLAALRVAGPVILPPLLIAAPLAAIQIAYDVASRSREWLPELSGSTAMAAVGSAIALAGGWPLGDALALWAILAARAMPSVLYVRARLRLEKGQRSSRPVVLAAHLAGLAAVLALAWVGLAPFLATVGLAVLAFRAAHGLSAWRWRVSTQALGFQEMAFGLLVVLAAFIGYTSGL